MPALDTGTIITRWTDYEQTQVNLLALLYSTHTHAPKLMDYIRYQLARDAVLATFEGKHKEIMAAYLDYGIGQQVMLRLSPELKNHLINHVVKLAAPDFIFKSDFEAKKTALHFAITEATAKRTAILARQLEARIEANEPIELVRQDTLKELEKMDIVKEDKMPPLYDKLLDPTSYNATTTGHKVGIPELDKTPIPLRGLTLIVAPPKFGKTSFAMQAATYNALDEGKHVVFFTLEETAEQVIKTMAAQRAKISAADVPQYAAAQDATWLKYVKALQELKAAPLTVVDAEMLAAATPRKRGEMSPSLCSAMMLDYVSRAYAKHGTPEMVFIDSLSMVQLNPSPYQPREDYKRAELVISELMDAFGRTSSLCLLHHPTKDGYMPLPPEDKDVRLSGVAQSNAILFTISYAPMRLTLSQMSDKEIDNHKKVFSNLDHPKGGAFVYTKHRYHRPNTVVLATFDGHTKTWS